MYFHDLNVLFGLTKCLKKCLIHALQPFIALAGVWYTGKWKDGLGMYGVIIIFDKRRAQFDSSKIGKYVLVRVAVAYYRYHCTSQSNFTGCIFIDSYRNRISIFHVACLRANFVCGPVIKGFKLCTYVL